MKREIHVADYAAEIMQALPGGVLLTTKSGDKVNSMTISWGFLGREWNKPIFAVLVRENRFTKTQLDQNPAFTVNIPFGSFNKQILAFCGSKSGRNLDKIKELGLHPEPGCCIAVPGIRELPLTLECKVIYRQLQDRSAISEADRKQFYPEDVDGSFYGANRDYHIMYFGEIVKAYIIE